MSLFSELRRRNVHRMALLYLGAAWLIMQVVDLLIDRGPFAESIGPISLTVMAIGFPIALIISWFYELTPEGIGLDTDEEPVESATSFTGRRVDFVIISLLAAAVLVFAYDKWWTSGPPEHSIAVLPFENMSDDPGQEYFSDGISEELLNLLAKIPELSVISRTSAFSYKGKDVRLSEIARELNVAHILEGSVRKSGNQLRITAQLIAVVTDTRLWSETYDRELENIFAIQDEIAAAVVNALKITLLGEAPKATETDPKTFALYLQARHFRGQATTAGHQQAESLLDQALVIDPGFAPAWTALASVYSEQTGSYSHRSFGFVEAAELARQAIQTALEIAPHDGRSYNVLANVAWFYDWDFEMAFQYLQEALKLNPSDADILRTAGELNTNFGRFKEANDLLQRSIALDPVSSEAHYRLGQLYYYTHRLDEAAATFDLALSLSPGGFYRHHAIGLVLLAQGDAQAALVAMRQETSNALHLHGMAIVQHALGNIGASDAALQELIEKYATGAAVQVASVYAFRNEVNSAFDWLEQAYENRDNGLSQILFNPMLANLYDDPRWNAFLDKMGLPN